jgi:hypothetical protein
MVIDISIMEDRLFHYKGTIFATDLDEDLSLVEKTLAESQQVPAKSNQIHGVEA